jgi:hypothetical protein
MKKAILEVAAEQLVSQRTDTMETTIRDPIH